MNDEAILKEHARAIFDAGVGAANPYKAVKASLKLEGDILKAGPEGAEVFRTSLPDCRRIVLVGGGKASALMAQSVESTLGDRIDEGIIIVKYGHGAPLEKVRLVEAGHPMPDRAGLQGTESILELIDSLGEDDLVISCLSGGGSALLPAPIPSITLEDKQALTSFLLISGATIEEINAVRKHCSLIKGGQLARRAAPATVVNLILSDVIGDRLDTIASGPFAPDETTFEDCEAILERYRLTERIPPAVVIHLKKGLDGEEPETPKRDDHCFSRVHNVVVADNRKVLQASYQKAESLGYNPCMLTASLQGESREVAKLLVAVAREVQQSSHPVPPPACLLAGGEPTVTVRGSGTGGRCQELALAGALAMKGLENVLMLAASTDGTDGPTDAAGALSGGSTVARAALKGLDPIYHLDNNDAYHFFQALGDLVITGPTLTNVMDIVCLLVRPPQ